MPHPFLQGYDEKAYTSRYPDIASAIANGKLVSGEEHYLKFGRHEGRRALRDFDEKWYLQTYPQADADIKSGLAKTAFAHFQSIGRFRGYLATPQAPRERNPSGFHSTFGGLWTDLGNAPDIVRGKLELGLITDQQAEMLMHWIRDGYVVIPTAIGDEVLDAVCAEFEAAFNTPQKKYLFECHAVKAGAIPWNDKLTTSASKGLDFHWFSENYRNLIFASKIRQFMDLVFERPPLATQSLSFYLVSSQRAHQDWAYVTYTLPTQFLASWTALEDVKPPAGELFYHPGSHRLDEFLFDGAHKSPHEAKRTNPGYSGKDDAQAYVDRLERRCEALGMWRRTFLPKRGDTLIWAAELVHGGNPITAGHTRKGIVAHYCPREVAPLYFESRRREIKRHEKNSYYTTAIY